MKHLSFSIALLACLCFGVANLYGQAETGQVTGTVVDPSGAAVPAAAVAVKNVATGAERRTTANDGGLFTISNLQPADYEVSVESKGFNTYKTRITITVGVKLGLDVKLEIGQTGTVVEVTGSSADVTVNTETQTIQQTLSTVQITELPTLTRDPYSLIATAGNVSPDDPSGRGAGYAINGLRSASTNVLLDGVANNDEFQAMIGQTVPLDSVQEIGITTNNFTAELGRASGGIINVTTKSGTNDFHGTAYGFNRVSALASNSFYNNAYGIPKSIYDRNQFGFSLGGPVIKNKLFFFSNTEWTRVRSIANEQVLTLDPALIAVAPSNVQSVFSQYGKLAPGASVLQTFSRNQLIAGGNDPCGGASPGGGCKSYNPDAPMFDLVTYNVPADAGGGSPQNTYNTVQRVDYNLSDKTQLYVRYALYSEVDQVGSYQSSPFAGFDSGAMTLSNSVAVSATHTFSSSFVSQTKLTFSRFNTLDPLGSNGVVPSFYLGSANSSTALGNYSVAMPGYYPTAPGNAIPFGGPQNSGQLYQDFGLHKGKHDLRFGGSVTYMRDNRSFGAYESSVNVMGKNTGSGLDNLLSGQEYEYEAAISPQGKFPCVNNVQTPACTITLPVGPPLFERSNRYHEGALYVQDSWKVSKTLTLNLGLRWEYFGPQHNVNSALDSNLYFPNGDQPSSPGFIQDVINSQVQTVPSSNIGSLWKPSWTNFGPRLGFAWDVFGDGKTSFRGGYAIGYERNFGNVTFNVLFNPPNYAVVDLIAGSNLATIPITANNAGPLSGSSGSAALPAAELRAVQPNIPQAYAHLLSASLEHQFFNKTHLEIDYSGSIGENQYDIDGVNFPGTGNFYGGIPCTPGSCNDVLNPQYGGINLRGAGGHSTYNAMNVRYDITDVGHTGVTLRLNYTYSHSIDDLSDTFSSSGNQFNLGYTDFQNPMVDKGSSQFDNRHRVAVSAIWDVPFARHMNRMAKYFLDGWELAPVFSARTGAPYTIYDITNDNAIYTRVILNQVMPAATRTAIAGQPDTYNIYNFSNISVNENYVNPITGTADFGPFPASMTGRDAFRTPGSWNLDLGAYKNTQITERVKLQLRLEAYNAVNHANFGYNTGSAYIYGGGGNIVGSYNGNRNIQLGAKVVF